MSRVLLKSELEFCSSCYCIFFYRMKKQRKVYTCVFVLDQNKNNILLGFKKRGLLEHKWNGFGGKIEPGETILDAAIRYVICC